LPVSFITLHRGEDLRTARVVAVSVDPEIVTYVASALLRDPDYVSSRSNDDPVVAAINQGRRKALRRVLGANG